MKCGGKKCDPPARYIMTVLGFFGLFNVYSMRVNLSVALVAMVNSTEVVHASNQTIAITKCVEEMIREDNMDLKKQTPFRGVQYDWNSKTQGLILGSFFYGYVLTQLPGGVLAEKYGSKWLFGSGIFVAALLSLLTPVVAASPGALITVRIIEGLTEGVALPAMNVLISRWAPMYERTRVSTIIYTGTLIGNVVTLPISGWLCSIDFLGGWPSVFYVFGGVGCIWFAFWSFLVFDSPDKHPRISHEELVFIQTHQRNTAFGETAHTIAESPPIPWKAIFTSLPVWAVIVAHVGHNFGYLILVTELPSFLGSVLHFDIKSNGSLSAIPYVMQAISAWISAFVADRLRMSRRFPITVIRKLFNTIGFLGPAICLLGVTEAGCRPKLIVALITLGMAINGLDYAGFNVTHVDMSPDFAGTLYGITNTFSNFCGILGPAMVSYFTRNEDTESDWNSVFYITSTVYILSAVFYFVFCSAEVQPWGEAKLIASNDLPSKTASKPNTDSAETEHGLNDPKSVMASKRNTDSAETEHGLNDPKSVTASKSNSDSSDSKHRLVFN